MPTVDPWVSAGFGVIFLAGASLELYGLHSKRKGQTITANWRWIDAWLHLHSPALDWFWRVFSAGLLVWMILHFLVGIR